MVSFSTILSAFALTSSAFAANGNFIIQEASSFVVGELASHHAPGVDQAKAAAIAGQAFDAIVGDKNVQAAIQKSLQALVNSRGHIPDPAEVRSLVNTGASAFNAYAQEPAYTSLVKLFEQNYLSFDWLGMYQDYAKSMAPYSDRISKYAPKAMEHFSSFYQDPNGKAAVQTMHSIGMRIANDVASIR